MAKASIVFIFILSLFLLAPFSLAICEINTKNAESFNLSFFLTSDASADIRLDLVIPFNEECLPNSDANASVKAGVLDCGYVLSYMKDAFFKDLGIFVLREDHALQHTLAESSLIDMNAASDLIAEKALDGSINVTFGNWNVVDSNAKSSLTIRVPFGSQVLSVYPQTGPLAEIDATKGEIFWGVIPKNKPGIKYLPPVPTNSIFFVVITLLVIAIAAISLFIFEMRKKHSRAANEANSIKLRMSILEKDFMKGKMDETTYRRLMEHHQLRLNELKAELAKSKNMERIEMKKFKE